MSDQLVVIKWLWNLATACTVSFSSFKIQIYSVTRHLWESHLQCVPRFRGREEDVGVAGGF